jgi:hypothetical protein
VPRASSVDQRLLIAIGEDADGAHRVERLVGRRGRGGERDRIGAALHLGEASEHFDSAVCIGREAGAACNARICSSAAPWPRGARSSPAVHRPTGRRPSGAVSLRASQSWPSPTAAALAGRDAATAGDLVEPHGEQQFVV